MEVETSPEDNFKHLTVVTIQEYARTNSKRSKFKKSLEQGFSLCINMSNNTAALYTREIILQAIRQILQQIC